MQKISPKLLAYCEAQTTKDKGSHWAKHLYLKLWPGSGACSECSKATRFVNMRVGFKPFCSAKCSNSNPAKLATTAKANLKKFGYTSPMGSAKVRAKFERTMQAKYGVSWAAQDAKIKRKQENTCEKRHGVRTMSQDPEVAASNARKYRQNSEASQAKRRKTMLKTYGYEHSLQVPEIFEAQQKSGFKIKSITLKGKTFRVRGYEPEALHYLVRELSVSPDDIRVTAADGKPHIDYKHNGERHVYHPDIYAKVKGKKWIIEVKSDYTAGLKPRSNLFTVMHLKLQATVDAGYGVKLFVITNDKQVHVIHDPHLKSKSEIRALVYNN